MIFLLLSMANFFIKIKGGGGTYVFFFVSSFIVLQSIYFKYSKHSNQFLLIRRVLQVFTNWNYLFKGNKNISFGKKSHHVSLKKHCKIECKHMLKAALRILILILNVTVLHAIQQYNSENNITKKRVY